ncbi:MAG TPA: carboxymuconolactone decarboxylase family protein, partial [Anaeromyxobacteraceae bacterium]
RAPREDRGAATGRGAPGAPQVASRLDYGRSAPDAVSALRQLETYVRGCGLEPSLLELIRLRASQLNGCAPCIDLHHRNARRAGETKERLDALATWPETPLFTPRERAGLAWSEAVTRVGIARVDDETYALAREQFDERELVNLTMAAVAINGWNRLAVAFRVEPGTYQLGLG